jgi:hypothetical protein
VCAYATRTLVNTYLAYKRLKQTGELLTGWFPESVVQAPEATLPPRGRAVVVLRSRDGAGMELALAILA